MSSFDAGRIVATADLDRSPFQRGLQEAKREAKDFAGQKYSAKLGADTKDGDAKVYDFKTRLERLGASTVSPKVALENGAGLRALIDFNDRLDKLRAKVATAKADVDDARAKAKLDALELQLRRVGLINSRARVSVEGVERANLQLDALGLKLAGINAAGGGGGRGRLTGGGGFFSRLPNGPRGLTLAAGAALPMAGPLAGVALGAGASFLSPTLAGGLGLGAFGIGAKASFTTVGNDVEQLTKLTQRYDAAVTNKQRAAVLRQEHMLWRNLDPAQRQAVKNVQALEESYKRYQKALEPQSFAVLADGAKLAEKGLHLLLPTAKGVGDELDNLLTRAQGSLGSPFWRHFFHDFLAVEAPLAVHTFGIGLGDTVQGIARLSERFAPLGHDLENMLLNTAGGFDKWTKGKGPAEFVAFVEKEGPIVARDLRALAHGLEGLGKGLGPIGQVELKALTPVLNFIGDLGDEHPAVITAVGTALLGVGAGLKVIAGVRGIQGILGGVGGLGRGGGGGLGGVVGRGAPVPVYVTNWGGEGGLPGGGGGTGAGGGDGRTALNDVGRVAGPVGLAAGAFVYGSNKYALTNKEALDRVQHPQGVALGYVPYVQQYVTAKYPNSVGTPYFNQLSAQALQHFSPRSGIADFTPTGVPESVLASVKKYQGGVDAAGKTALDASAKVKGLAGDTNNLNIIMLKNPGVAAKMEASLRRLAGEAKIDGAMIGGDLGQGLIQGVEAIVPHATMAGKMLVASTVKSMRLAADAHSPSRETERLAVDMGLGLIVGWRKISGEVNSAFSRGTTTGLKFVENAMARGVASTVQRLAGARAHLGADVSGRRDYITGLTGTYEGYAGISGAINSNGSVGNVAGFLRSRLSKLKQFVNDLGKLRRRGLSPMLLQQIADLGPDGGLGLAQSILSGDSGSIGTLNRLQRQVDSYAGRGAAIAGHGVFDTRIAGDEKHVRELINAVKDQRDDLRKVLAAIKANPHAFASALDQIMKNSQHHHNASAA